MKYAYYPGCSLSSTGIEYDLSTRAVAKHLGVDLWEIPDWNCCGATSAHTTDHLLAMALPARTLAQAEQAELDVAVPCAACFNRMKTAEAALKKSETTRAKITEIIEMDYQGKASAYALLDIFTRQIGLENVAKQVKRPLAGLKVACYYGCYLVRPPQVTGFDDPENPQSMDRLMTTLGATPLNWPYKTECCGAGLGQTKPEIGLKLIHDILRVVKEFGAEAIVAACPLCFINLDMRQSEVARRYGQNFNIPVFYFTELMAWAFGEQPATIGLSRHFVEATAIMNITEQRLSEQQAAKEAAKSAKADSKPQGGEGEA
ncbi:MAG: CoB--CoM heterodisulfide reductase iron-sulfur subunit B family protein [Firmicutes bacterium]|nr:CoB--CoM heterodisulfide reductase iron-sulfur subunit B family protein [Bacillota bacterium]